jgi:HlyD family secretion protein
VTGGLPEGAAIVAMPPKGADEGRLARIGDAP